MADYSALSELRRHFYLYPGATRFALAPGYHISRLRRCNLKSYFAPSALQSEIIFRAFGAQNWEAYGINRYGAGRIREKLSR
jgi:hypothetical protein